MSKNPKEPAKKVVGSTHFTNLHSHKVDLNKKNDISSVLFERQKEKYRQELIERYAKSYEKALNVIEQWQKEIEKLKRPENVVYQQVSGTEGDFIEVGQWSKQRKEQLSNLTEKYDKLCKLLDSAYENSNTQNFEALENFLNKVK